MMLLTLESTLESRQEFKLILRMNRPLPEINDNLTYLSEVRVFKIFLCHPSYFKVDGCIQHFIQAAIQVELAEDCFHHFEALVKAK